jgi:hypothetical protein
VIKKSWIILFLICLILIVGCEYQSITNFYITDVLEIQKTKEPLELESIIKIEVPSKDIFIESKEEITGILTPFFDLNGELYSEENGMSTYAVAKVNIPFIFESGKTSGKEFMYFVVSDKKDVPNFGLSTIVRVLFNQDRYNKFQDLVESQFFDNIDPTEFTLNIVLHNDQRVPAEAVFISSYVDGQPEPFTKTVKLKRRNTVDVILSKIYMQTAMKENTADLFLIKHNKSDELAKNQKDQS